MFWFTKFIRETLTWHLGELLIMQREKGTFKLASRSSQINALVR